MSLTIHKYPSAWNDAFNPIIVEGTSTLFPVNNHHTKYTIQGTSVTNANSFASFTLSTSPDKLFVGAWIKVSSAEYNAVCQVRDIDASNVVTSLPFDSPLVHSGTIQQYAYNHKAILRLYAEVAPGSDTFEEVTQLEQKANAEGSYRFDLAPYLRSLLDAPAITGTQTTFNQQCSRRFGFSMGESYVGRSSLSGEPEQTLIYLNDTFEVQDGSGEGCGTTDLFTSTWSFAGDGNNWGSTGAGSAAITFDGALTSQLLYQAPSGGVESGKLYKLHYSIALPDNCNGAWRIQVVLRTNGPSVGNEYEYIVRDESAVGGAEGANILGFLVPEHPENDPFTGVGIRLYTDEGCLEGNISITGIALYAATDCMKEMHAHYSAYQYTEQPGVSAKLLRHTVQDISRLFLTNYPRAYAKEIMAGDHEWLGILYGLDPQTDLGGNAVYPAFTVTYYDEAGNVISSQEAEFDGTKGRYDFLTGLDGLAAAGLGPASTPATYTVHIQSPGNTQATEKFTYRVVDCSSAYRKRLYWLNARGGWDSFSFTGKGEHALDVERQGAYKRNIMNLGFEAPNRQYGNLQTTARRTAGLESSFCPRPVAEWLWEAAASPNVYLELEATDGKQYVPVEVDGSSFRMYSDGDRLYSVSLKVRYAFDLISVEG